MRLVGVDVGTSVVKAVCFDELGRECDAEVETTTVLHRDDGAREQDMAEVWAAVARVLGTVVGRCDTTVDLVAVTAQGDGCWLIDEHGAPTGHALLWNDNRGAGYVADWQRDGTSDAAFRISGCLGAPGMAHAQLRWLLDHEPHRLEASAQLLSCGSWVFSRLTGERVLESSEAANPFGSVVTGDFAPELLELFGIEDLARLLPPIVGAGERLAPVLDDVARELGLPSGTPVVLAPYDVVTTAVGSGVVGVGSSFAVLGTTLCVGRVEQGPRMEREVGGMSLPLSGVDRWLVAYATLTGTETLHWATELLGLADVVELGRVAASSSRHTEPLLLPYLSAAGERSPFLDPAVRGSLHGLQLGQGRAEVARAVFDGLTLAIVDCLDTLGRPASLTLSGGGSRSAMWLQDIADATGVEARRVDTSEASARGAVLVGAVELGVYADLDEAVAAAVHADRSMRPDPAETEWFAGRYAELVRLRSLLRG